MSNAGPRSCGERQTYRKPLRKPGESVQESGAEHEEKPPVGPSSRREYQTYKKPLRKQGGRVQESRTENEEKPPVGPSSNRERQTYKKPLRKPGGRVQESGAEQKPPVQPAAGVDGNQQEDKIEQGVSSSNKELNNQENQVGKRDDELLRAVGNPEFVPRSIQQPGAISSLSSSSFLQSAIHAPEFIPGKPFHKYEETPEERRKSIEKFVSGKIKQIRDDPGLLDEISIHMAKYLSRFIKNEDDLKSVSDLLFAKCVSEQNFQYTGSRLANHLDKSLNPAGLSGKAFRVLFLKRCQVENERVGDMIQNNSDKVSNFAFFWGELLINYKTADGSPFNIFYIVVLDIIDKLLGSNDRKHLICAGKLLKLTGCVLEENQEELFQKVKQMASNPNVDRTARDLFTRVGQLRSTNWGRDQKLSQSTQPPPPPEASVQASSLYIEDLEGTSLDEQLLNDVLPVVTEEQWNEFYVHGEEDNSEEDPKELYKQMCLERNGGGFYPLYATADNSNSSYHNDDEDDYDADYEYFEHYSRQ